MNDGHLHASHYPSHNPRLRLLAFPGAHNVRDLGGIPLSDGGVIDCGKVLRGEAPALLGPAGVRAMLDYGVRHVIDLRSDRERRVEGHGALQPHIDAGAVHLHAVPLVADNDWDVLPNGRPDKDSDGSDVATDYLHGLDYGGIRLAEALRVALADAVSGRGSVYVHCALGKDRTGVVSATLLDAMGASHAGIVDDYALTAETIRPIVAVLGQTETYKRDLRHPDWSRILPKPQAMSHTLSALSARGGGLGWLTAHGVGPDTIAAWRTGLRYQNPGLAAASA